MATPLTSRLYAIKNRETGDFFAGFCGGVIRWTGLATEAWSTTHAAARAQASLLICNAIPAQRKVVAL